MKKHLFYIAAAALMLAACSNDERDIQNNDDIIKLSANIATPVTRATATDALQNTQFNNSTAIHVDVYETGGSAPMTNGSGTYTTTNTTGALSGSLYYPTNGNNIDIEAYYPSTVTYSTTSFNVLADQSSAANYCSSDLMYATKLTNKAKGTTHGLTFNHALSKIIVNITNGSGVTAGDITSNVSAVKINNTKLTATIAKGVVSAATGSATDITITGTTNTSNIGIIVPQTVVNGSAFITVTYNSNDYAYTLTADKTFEAGKVYTYALTLTAQGISLSSTTITDWIPDTGDSQTITL